MGTGLIVLEKWEFTNDFPRETLRKIAIYLDKDSK